MFKTGNEIKPNDFAYLNPNGTKVSTKRAHNVSASQQWSSNEYWMRIDNTIGAVQHVIVILCGIFQITTKRNKKKQTNDFGFELKRKSCNEYHSRYGVSNKPMWFNRTHVNIKHLRLYCNLYSLPFRFTIKRAWILNHDLMIISRSILKAHSYIGISFNGLH